MRQRTLTDLGAGISPDLLRRHLATLLRHADAARIRNAILTQVDKRRGRARVSGRPFMIKVEATNQCPFSCPGCYTGAGSDGYPRGKMSLDLYAKVLDDLGRHLLKVALYAWGEPLLNEHIYEMIRIAGDRNIGTMVSTNLHPFAPEDAGRLLDAGLEHLIVSVDGMSQQTYATYRRGGRLDRVLENLRHLLQEKRRRGARFPTVEMQYIVFPHNRAEIPLARRTARELGVDLLSFLEGQAMEPGERALSRRSRAAGRRGCDLLWTSTYVNWDGSVSPCCFVNDNVFGTMAESSFEEIWNGPFYRASRALALGRDPRDAPPAATRCRACLLGGSSSVVR